MKDIGAERRDAGHASALSHYAVEIILDVILEKARALETFTSEDVHDGLPLAAKESLAMFPNALGACIRAAAKAGKIEPTGSYVASNRPEARKRKIGVWRLKR